MFDILPNMNDPILSVLIVEGHPLVREALCTLIAGEPDFEVAGQNITCGNVLAMICQTEQGSLVFTVQPDLILFSFGEKDELALSTIRSLASLLPDTPILALAPNDSPDRLLAAHAAGARMILPKSIPIKDLLNAMRSLKQPCKTGPV